MSVYKEAIHSINLIVKCSRQIFPDALDYGAPTKKGDFIWNAAKQLVEWYGEEGTRKVEKYETGTTVRHRVRYMPNEHDSPIVRTIEVVFVSTRKNKAMDGYVYINPLIEM